MICNNNYFADILGVCEIKDLIWVMRFQSPLVYDGDDLSDLVYSILHIKLGGYNVMNMAVSFAGENNWHIRNFQ